MTDGPELLAIVHEPIAPPRKGHDGERAYLGLWQRFMSRLNEEELHEIFRATRYEALTQRQASVAASFVLWLGTNCGRGFIAQANNREGSRFGLRYLSQWEVENRREVGVNNGLRYCEAILEPDRDKGGQLLMHTAPTVTIDDLDVIDCICLWLATMDGQHFLRAAEAKVEAATSARLLFGDDAAPFETIDAP